MSEQIFLAIVFFGILAIGFGIAYLRRDPPAPKQTLPPPAPRTVDKIAWKKNFETRWDD